ncbi:MAG: hypothetical protein KGI54_15240 [Pseudomonadota bacterium]|nr:hypothetical protein [Pseudomonadota bacterium]
MKSKTINKVLCAKFDEWAASIEDEALRQRVKKNTVITRGAIASMLLQEPVNDFDVYFKDWQTNHDVAQYYLKRFHLNNKSGIPCEISLKSQSTGGLFLEEPEFGKRIKIVVKSAGIASEDGADAPYEYFEGSPDEHGAQYVSEVMGSAGDIEDRYEEVESGVLQAQEDNGKPKYRPVFVSSNAITLSNKIQIIIRFWGEPDQLHENYDFVHCTNYWTSWERKVVLKEKALETLLTKELRYVGSKYPLCSVMRIRKFIQRGWTINAGQILKMLMQLNELDLCDPVVLEDQLTGVDSAYFAQVISRLREKNPERIESAYLIEIVNRMF